MTCMVPVMTFRREAFCLPLETIVTEEHSGLMECFVTLCNNNHLKKTHISTTSVPVVDYCCVCISVYVP